MTSMTAGYSGTPLLQKLGLKPSTRLLLINPPADYMTFVQTDLTNQLVTRNAVPDLVHLFVESMKEFKTRMNKLKPVCKKNPAIVIWVSWYKKASRINTDVNEDHIRNYALANDLVDVKVCAVNEIWSALKLVVPLAKRN
jgi:hypothetical protein